MTLSLKSITKSLLAQCELLLVVIIFKGLAISLRKTSCREKCENRLESDMNSEVKSMLFGTMTKTI